MYCMHADELTKYIFFVYALDINECQQSPSVCHPLAKCSNTEGSFSCQCGVGYTGNGFVNCTGICINTIYLFIAIL